MSEEPHSSGNGIKAIQPKEIEAEGPVKCQLYWHINLKAFSSLFELMRSA
jgi:hypothetical protein